MCAKFQNNAFRPYPPSPYIYDTPIIDLRACALQLCFRDKDFAQLEDELERTRANCDRCLARGSAMRPAVYPQPASRTDRTCLCARPARKEGDTKKAREQYPRVRGRLR